MIQKFVLLTPSLCLPVVLLIFPLGFSRQSMAADTGSRSTASFEAFSASACANSTRSDRGTDRLAVSAGTPAAPEGCADPIDKCKRPIKYLGAKGDCTCFACEYGKATQHNICTQNKRDKDTLLAESGPQ